MEDDPTGYPSALWKQLAETGVLGLLIPESHGGAGMDLLDAAIVYEEFGRSLAPSPHFASAVLGAGVLRAARSAEQQQSWLPRIASGEAILTPAWLEPDGSFGPRGVRLTAEPFAPSREDSEAGFVLRGVKRHVPFASAATRWIVLARTGPDDAAIDLFLVDPHAPGVTMTQQRSLASDTQYEVRFDGVRVPATARIGPAGSGWATWDGVLLDGIVLLAALAMGGAERALEITVQYAKDRKQFDKPLGAFQAIAHYMRDFRRRSSMTPSPRRGASGCTQTRGCGTRIGIRRNSSMRCRPGSSMGSSDLQSISRGGAPSDTAAASPGTTLPSMTTGHCALISWPVLSGFSTARTSWGWYRSWGSSTSGRTTGWTTRPRWYAPLRMPPGGFWRRVIGTSSSRSTTSATSPTTMRSFAATGCMS
jgi:hypothetical protein